MEERVREFRVSRRNHGFILVLYSHQTRDRCFPRTIFSNGSGRTMLWTKIKSGSYTKSRSRRRSGLVFPFSPSSLLRLILALLCWRAGADGRKVGNESQVRQAARNELRQRPNPHGQDLRRCLSHSLKLSREGLVQFYAFLIFLIAVTDPGMR